MTVQSSDEVSIKPPVYFSQSRPEMMKFIPSKAKRILDVGCAEGNFGASLKNQLGSEVWGVEPVPSIAEIASQRLDRVLCGDISAELSQCDDGYFDCIVFNDVLEHLIDPSRVLVDVKRKLSRNGVVVASIPNIRYFPVLKDLVLHGQWEYEDAGILDRTHLRFFTRKSIAKLFPSLGYRILQLEGINPRPSWKATLLNFAVLGKLTDTRYLQFACVAQPIR
ncbi:MAG TPA: class I SAM-dependent methyltransferase [Chthoniobacterales bacterium]|jgi:2-polyprenyl-3-methyl-5-hydroxy-6-metoxy-1,4-benzoquinol methylase